MTTPTTCAQTAAGLARSTDDVELIGIDVIRLAVTRDVLIGHTGVYARPGHPHRGRVVRIAGFEATPSSTPGRHLRCGDTRLRRRRTATSVLVPKSTARMVARLEALASWRPPMSCITDLRAATDTGRAACTGHRPLLETPDVDCCAR